MGNYRGEGEIGVKLCISYMRGTTETFMISPLFALELRGITLIFGLLKRMSSS
jgi:hypothetical protein